MYFSLFFSLLFILLFTLPSYSLEIVENNNYSAKILRLSNKYKVYPSISIYGATVLSLAKKENAFASINAGFFNHSNLQTVSYVYKNGQIIANPEKNKQLINNKNLKGIINKIINNRVEFRVLKSENKLIYDISPHNKKIEKGFRLLHSIQAGPNLLPIIEPEKEGFILKNKKGQIIRDGISFYNRASRSALGIDLKGNLVLFAIYAKNKKGMTIPELSSFVKSKGVIKAMAFDGGSSVSLVWKENGKYKLFGNNNKIKSALIIKSEK